MTSQEQQLQELTDLVSSLQAENLALKQNNRAEHEQRDVNDAAGETLRLGQLRYRTIFENSLLGNKIISSDLKILQVNQRLVNLLGYASKKDLIGHEILEFAHENFIDDWRILQQKLWAKQMPSFSLETCLLHKGGKGIWVNVTSILFRDDNSNLGYTIIEDIGERKRGLDILAIREKRFRMITDIMPQQVWTAAPDGQLNFVNQQVCEYFGRAADDLVGNGWQDFIHPDDIPGCLKVWTRSLETGKEYVIEFRLRGKDSDYQWYLGRAVPIRDEDGEITVWLGTNTNIHAQKNNEYKKDEFLSIASHELKTPLTTIRAFFQLAKREAGQHNVLGQFAGKAERQLDRLGRLIEDLLDVSKINAGKLIYNMEDFDFGQMLSDTIDSTQQTNSKHRIEFSRNCSVVYHGDRHRIEQVVINLLNNAIKYSPDADRIIVTCEADRQSLIVSVQDFGIGIAKEHLNGLFDRYYRVDNTAMRFEGLGLGLYISSEILKRHRGSFWIDTRPGEGSTFFFRLPLTTALATAYTAQEDFYQDRHIRISYIAARRRLHVDWTGFQDLHSVQQGCMRMLEYLQKHQVDRIVNDNSHVLGNWADAVDWVGNIWFPMMERAGLRYFAHLISPSIFSELSAKKSIDIMAGIITTQYFTDFKLAEEWIDQQL